MDSSKRYGFLMDIKKSSNYDSWGRVFHYDHYVMRMDSSVDYESNPDLIFSNLSSTKDPKKCLVYGQGRSYGDSCLLKDGLLLDSSSYSKILSFDDKRGVLRAQAGITLDEILRFVVPKGWFLPVTPGTKYVSLGGAIANDVHGKNHHKQGTFGNHIEKLLLLRSNGVFECSLTQNEDLFRATISGLGLTGIILWADLKLTPIKSHLIDTVNIKIKNLDEFFDMSNKYDSDYESTVAWIDCIAKGKDLGRGIFMLGNHAESYTKPYNPNSGRPILSVPFDFPNFTLNSFTIKLFNLAYYYKQIPRVQKKRVHFDGFYYPLDIISKWNRIYGSRGFYQYQFVVGVDKKDVVTKCLEKIASSNMASFLAVLKKFGDVSSPGMLSFPKPGYTLALDFPNYHEKLSKLFSDLDELVLEAGGRLYPAKDAMMDRNLFCSMYPEYKEFKKYVDPLMASSFYQRVFE